MESGDNDSVTRPEKNRLCAARKAPRGSFSGRGAWRPREDPPGSLCGSPVWRSPRRGRAFPAWRPATTLSKEKATHFHFSPNHLETPSEKNYLVKTLVAFQVRLRCEYKQGCAPSRRGGEGATLTPAVTTCWVKPVRGRQAGTASALGPSPPHSPLPSASY